MMHILIVYRKILLILMSARILKKNFLYAEDLDLKKLTLTLITYIDH